MGGFGPAEGFGIFVPVGQEAGDGLLQARDAVEAAAANGLRGDQAEPALDQVEPRGSLPRPIVVRKLTIAVSQLDPASNLPSIA